MIKLTLLLSVLCVSLTSASEITPRILNGIDAPKTPWILPIFEPRNHARPEFKCAGSVVGDKWILTEKSCVNVNETQLFVVVRNKYSVRVIKVYVDNDDSSLNNLALLRLSNTVEISPFSLQKDNDLEYDGHQATIYGTGRTETGKVSYKLKTTNVTLIDRNDCDKNSVCFNPKLTNSNNCYGDTGAPMVLNDDSHQVIVGVAPNISEDEKCTIDGKSSYISVPFNYKWIKDTMDKN